MANFFARPLGWVFGLLGLMIGLVAAFAIFKPVQVMPRMAAGPEYTLINQEGSSISERTFAGRITLYGFGYTYDPTGALEQTLSDMQMFQARMDAEELGPEVSLALILFDDERDTPERLHALSAEHQLDLSNWTLLSGDADTLKRTIGQGFGVYYEAVPISDLPHIDAQGIASAEGYGYLQAQRYILVDDVNIIRAEYRTPLDLDRALRDIRLIIREKYSTGASRTLNEAAHLFLCYPD